jgi:tRNA-dihydrouridine synthase B
MKIGNLDLGRNAILSPMADITDAPYRQLCREYGAGLTFTQMISAKGIIENSFLSLKSLAFRRDEKPIGIQLLANDEYYLEKAVEEVTSLKPDIIELNSSCSVSKVCNFGLGASILDEPELLGRLVKSMVKASNNIPVSIKLRLGKDNRNINILKNARIAEENGASSITIHAKTRKDLYVDSPEWQWIKKAKEVVSIPVIGNGGIFEPQDAIKLLNETGCDSVFIARGSMGNPFIFKRFNAIMESGVDPGEPGMDEVANTAIRHFDLLLKDSGNILGIKKARKFLVWYFKYTFGIYKFIEKLYSLNEPELIREFILEYAQDIKQSNYPEMDLNKIKENFNERVLFWIDENQHQADNIVH